MPRARGIPEEHEKGAVANDSALVDRHGGTPRQLETTPYPEHRTRILGGDAARASHTTLLNSSSSEESRLLPTAEMRGYGTGTIAGGAPQSHQIPTRTK